MYSLNVIKNFDNNNYFSLFIFHGRDCLFARKHRNNSFLIFLLTENGLKAACILFLPFTKPLQLFYAIFQLVFIFVPINSSRQIGSLAFLAIFGSVFCLKAYQPFVCYLMPKLSFQKNSNGITYPIARGAGRTSYLSQGY